MKQNYNEPAMYLKVPDFVNDEYNFEQWQQYISSEVYKKYPSMKDAIAAFMTGDIIAIQAIDDGIMYNRTFYEVSGMNISNDGLYAVISISTIDVTGETSDRLGYAVPYASTSGGGGGHA